MRIPWRTASIASCSLLWALGAGAQEPPGAPPPGQPQPATAPAAPKSQSINKPGRVQAANILGGAPAVCLTEEAGSELESRALDQLPKCLGAKAAAVAEVARWQAVDAAGQKQVERLAGEAVNRGAEADRLNAVIRAREAAIEVLMKRLDERPSWVWPALGGALATAGVIGLSLWLYPKLANNQPAGTAPKALVLPARRGVGLLLPAWRF